MKARIETILQEVEQAAREIYYAKTLIEPGHPAQANLDLALKNLGIYHPNEVGLSNRALKSGHHNI